MALNAGVQGQDGWWYGYYNRSADLNGIYNDAKNFSLMLYYRGDMLDFPLGGPGGRWQVYYNNPLDVHVVLMLAYS
jgi:hypothetical protein